MTPKSPSTPKTSERRAARNDRRAEDRREHARFSPARHVRTDRRQGERRREES